MTPILAVLFAIALPLATPADSVSISDSDYVYLFPLNAGSIFIPSPGTTIVQGVLVDVRTAISGLTIPIYYGDPVISWYPYIDGLQPDTSVITDSVTRGLTFGQVGHDSIWDTRTVIVDTVAKTIFIQFQTTTPAQRLLGALCWIHWWVMPNLGFLGAAKIDTLSIAGEGLSLRTDSSLLIPHWEAGAVFMGEVGIDEATKPEHFALIRNFPNPFNASTQITYALPQPAYVTLTVYDALGRKIETLVQDTQSAGEHALVWDAGSRGSGVYFLVLDTPSRRRVQKALLLK